MRQVLFVGKLTVASFALEFLSVFVALLVPQSKLDGVKHDATKRTPANANWT